uniref:Uncharacterized protein n=1 Tax=Lepeophtheirus salmonis TaxID=72036 RepID=A0A0K2VDE5_LEPSM
MKPKLQLLGSWIGEGSCEMNVKDICKRIRKTTSVLSILKYWKESGHEIFILFIK